MRTSCRFAVAVHVLVVLAYRAGGWVTSASLARSVNTHPVIIRRLLLTLQEGKLVQTSKGAGAGSRLNRPPKCINLAEVYRVVEDSEPFVTPARKPNAACPVGKCMPGVLRRVFASARSALEKDLARTTLADLLECVQSPRKPRGEPGVDR